RRTVSLADLSESASPLLDALAGSDGQVVSSAAATACLVSSESVRPRACALDLSAGPRPRRSTARKSRGAAMMQRECRLPKGVSGTYRDVLGRVAAHCRTASLCQPTARLDSLTGAGNVCSATIR